MAVARAEPLGTLGVKIKVKTSPQYLAEVAKAKTLGHDFWCESVAEELKSKDYSSLPEYPSVYSMVVLNCKYNPHDGLDVIRMIGLATFADNQVLNFSVANVHQPD
jgi:hypothetical protein